MADRIKLAKRVGYGTKAGNKPWQKRPDPDTMDLMRNRGRSIDDYVDQATTGRKR